MNGNKQDKNVPIETRIYYSPFSLGVHWVLGTALLLYGTYLSLDQGFFGYFLQKKINNTFAIRGKEQQNSKVLPH